MKDNTKESIIHGIFPIPIYKSYLDRKLTNKELLFIEKTKLDTNKNEGNITSNDNYILENKIFNELKKELLIYVYDYFNKVISTKNNITPYITQSWINYTEENQFHHRHYHQNSIISGVYYINADEQNDKITFFKTGTDFFKFRIKEFNAFNAEAWFFPVKNNEIILFPSNTIHMVDVKKGNNLRISLAFNVFIKGKLGLKEKLTELIL